MEYFEEMELGPQCPTPTPWWKWYVDIICITKKVQVYILFAHINKTDDHIKLTMEHPDKEGSTPFLDPKCTPHSSQSIKVSVYTKPAYTNRYLDLEL